MPAVSVKTDCDASLVLSGKSVREEEEAAELMNEPSFLALSGKSIVAPSDLSNETGIS